jgi:glutaminase
MTRVYKKHLLDTSGEVAQYIPGLGMAYTDVFGMALATVNKGLVC